VNPKTANYATAVAQRFLGTPAGSPPTFDPAIIAMIIQIVQMVLERCPRPQAVHQAIGDAASNDYSPNRVFLGVAIRTTMNDLGYPRRFGDVANLRSAMLAEASELPETVVTDIVNENLYLGV
jgi:hypothetical protein